METIRQFFTAPIFPDDDQKTNNAANTFLIAKILLAITIIILPYSVLRLQLTGPVITMLVVIFPLISALWLIHQGWATSGALLVTTVITATTYYTALDSGGLLSAGFLSGGVLSVLMAGFLLGWRGSLSFSIIGIIVGAMLIWLDNQDRLPPMRANISSTSILFTQGLFFLCATGILFAATRRLQNALQQARTELVERQKTEQALRESEARYTRQLEQTVKERTAELQLAKEQIEAILEHTRDAIALVRDNGDIQIANPAFKTLFGTVAEQIIEGILWTITDNTMLPIVAHALLDALRADAHQSLATSIEASNGEQRDIDLTFVPIEADTSRHIVFSVHDITHIKEIERFKMRFVDHAVHDLGSPISALSTRLYVLKQDRANFEQHLAALESQVQQLHDLLQDLRMLAQLDHGAITLKRAPAQVNDIVQHVLALYEPLALEKQQTLDRALADGLPAVQVDRHRMERVITNLLTNAIHYTPAGKRITLRTRIEAGRIVFDISDEGIGISAEDQARIFERFYRADVARSHHRSGSGLGLAIVKDIIELHGGTISLVSAENEGSTFTVRLPV